MSDVFTPLCLLTGVDFKVRPFMQKLFASTMILKPTFSPASHPFFYLENNTNFSLFC